MASGAGPSDGPRDLDRASIDARTERGPLHERFSQYRGSATVFECGSSAYEGRRGETLLLREPVPRLAPGEATEFYLTLRTESGFPIRYGTHETRETHLEGASGDRGLRRRLDPSVLETRQVDWASTSRSPFPALQPTHLTETGPWYSSESGSLGRSGSLSTGSDRELTEPEPTPSPAPER